MIRFRYVLTGHNMQRIKLKQIYAKYYICMLYSIKRFYNTIDHIYHLCWRQINIYTFSKSKTQTSMKEKNTEIEI